MYFIDCIYFKDAHFNRQLVVSPDGAKIQYQEDNDIVLIEWDIPIFNQGDQNIEVCFILCEKIFKIIRDNPIVIIFQDRIESLTTSFYFKMSDHLSWDTWIPRVTCIMKVPVIDFLEQDTVTLQVQEQKLCIKDGPDVIYKFQTFFMFEEHSINVQTFYLQDVFTKHTGKVCKLYIHEESPVCIELFEGPRIFIAPVII